MLSRTNFEVVNLCYINYIFLKTKNPDMSMDISQLSSHIPVYSLSWQTPSCLREDRLSDTDKLSLESLWLTAVNGGSSWSHESRHVQERTVSRLLAILAPCRIP